MHLRSTRRISTYMKVWSTDTVKGARACTIRFTAQLEIEGTVIIDDVVTPLRQHITLSTQPLVTQWLFAL